MIIRKMTNDDLDSVSVLESVSFKRPWDRQALHDFLSCDHCLALIAEQANVDAFVIANECSDRIEILRIAVAPSKRGSGLARGLLSELFVIAGSRKIILDVSEKNTAAVSLYSSLGFKVTGRRRLYYGDSDALLMDRLPEIIIKKADNR